MTAALALGVAVAVGSTAFADPGDPAAPVVTVSPSTGLNDGDVVTVVGSGLTPDTVYHVGECVFVQPGVLGCDRADSVDVTSDAGGSVSATLTVRQVFDASTGPEGTPAGSVDCGSSQCTVGLGDDSGLGGGQPISFAPASTDQPLATSAR